MSYITERRQEERDRRRGEIVDAAEALYSEVGWDAVTMDQVARRGGGGRPPGDFLIKFTRDLHFALVERSLDALRDRFEAAREGKASGIEEVEAIGRAYLAFAHETPHFFDACARFQSHASAERDVPPNEAACMCAGHRVHEVMVASLNRGIADGSIRSDIGDPYVTALSLWAVSFGVIQIAASKAGQMEHEGVAVQQFVEHAFALALRSLQR
jgi:AcrR family transcriptional regulator